VKFMLALPFGTAYQLGQNTSSCRTIHQNMVPLRPEVHCPHIGPYRTQVGEAKGRTGGSQCVPRDYVQVTTQKYFFNGFVAPPP
jgi:hypothetical protein